jgi:hypothetical protein
MGMPAGMAALQAAQNGQGAQNGMGNITPYRAPGGMPQGGAQPQPAPAQGAQPGMNQGLPVNTAALNYLNNWYAGKPTGGLQNFNAPQGGGQMPGAMPPGQGGGPPPMMQRPMGNGMPQGAMGAPMQAQPMPQAMNRGPMMRPGMQQGAAPQGGAPMSYGQGAPGVPVSQPGAPNNAALLAALGSTM